jgi:hypothetical protein
MKSAVWCFSLLFVFIIGCSGGNAFAESTPAEEGPSILPASNIQNTAVDQVPVDPKASSYASAIRTSAGVHPDSGAVKQTNPPQQSPPSSSGPKATFWQWISGKKVDCSSGVCTFK